MSTVNGFQVGSETLKYNYESLDNYNTPNFSTSSSKTYAVGDYVMYNGKLYKCTTATTGGTWVSGNWTLAVLSDDVSDLNRQLNDVTENEIPELKSAISNIAKEAENSDSALRKTATILNDSQTASTKVVPKNALPFATLKSASALAKKVVSMGVNLYSKETLDFLGVSFVTTDNVVNLTANNASYTFFYKCEPNTAYTASRKAVATADRFYMGYTKEIPQVGSVVYGMQKVPNTQTVGNNLKITITTGDDAEYIVVWVYHADHTSAKDTFQLEKGDTQSAYSEYFSRTYNISDVKDVIYGIEVKPYGTLNFYDENDDSISVESTIEYLIVKPNNDHNIRKLSVASQNIRDFSPNSTPGCPDDLVQTNLPLWKEHISKWLNQDFLVIVEWYPYFDRSETINAYNTLFKQFYPYKIELPEDAPTMTLLSKVNGTLGNFNKAVFNLPYIETEMYGKSICIMAWKQSNTQTVLERQESYSKAINFLSKYDIAVVAGDFNNSSMDELSTWTDAGYVLGNGGYWGNIETHPTDGSIDNMVSKGLIFDQFEAGEKATSDHKAIRGIFAFESR